jgi:hypothetical protein
LTLISASRPGLLLLYDHDDIGLRPSTSNEACTSIPKASSSRGISRTAPSTLRNPIISNRTSPTSSPSSKEWLRLLWLPKMRRVDEKGISPDEENQQELAILGMLFTNVVAAWIGFLASIENARDFEVSVFRCNGFLESGN